MVAPNDNELALLAVRAGEQLLRRKLRAVTAESCTGGLVAKLLTDVPGSSQLVRLRLRLLFELGQAAGPGRVARRRLREFGAVSEPTVTKMAMGALARSGADRAVAISGVAGPDGGTPDHPVGEVWFALAHALGHHH